MRIQLLLLVSVFFFNHLFSNNGKSDTLTITIENDGDTVQVTRGTILILQLEAIPGTGYAWQADSPKFKYLTAIKGSYFLPKGSDSANSAIGAPAYQVLSYLAKKTGTETLKLLYKREWEKNTPPLKTFSITIRIKK